MNTTSDTTKSTFLTWLISMVMAWTIMFQGDGMAQVQEQPENKELSALFNDYWEWQMRTYPTWATYLGDKRYDSLLPDISPASRAASELAVRNFLERARAFDKSVLSSEEQVSRDMFVYQLQESVDNEVFKDYTMPVSQQDGPHIMLPSLMSSTDFTSLTDYEHFEKRLRAFPRYVRQIVDDLREGKSLGLVACRTNIEPVSEQIQALINQNYKESIFYTPLRENRANLSPVELKKLDRGYEDAIYNYVNPALRLLDNVLKIEYLPWCREAAGVGALPDGKQRYLALIKRHTTLPLSPEEITQMGYDDLEWIHASMDSVMISVGFSGTRREFFHHLHTSPEFYHTNADSLVAGYQSILDAIILRLPELFGRLPKAPCVIKVIEPFRAADATTAFYSGPAVDGSRPGQYYVNTYALDQRPKYEMEALSYHESVPGHHLQIAIAQELQGLPLFRKNTWVTAYGEGWALYSERLPKELGFYSNPYSEFGRLIYEAWRACRLVVDVGIHYFGWTREQAIEFMKDNYGGTDHNVEKEVERYMADPGQALGYKIGQLKILELRKRAETHLGTHFTIKEFHDKILESGCVPLSVLESKIDTWIKEKK